GGIAHDFNNQLTGMTMGIDLVEQSVCQDEKSLRYTQFIRTCAKRASELTLKLLTFAHSSPSLPAPTDIHDVIREVMSILEHSIDKTIDVDAKLEATDSVVLADAAQLQSALLNIAVNARDAMPGGGRIELASETVRVEQLQSTACGLVLAPGCYVRVAVSDTGKGMEEQMLERIFEPFFTTKPRGQGTGLGLATAYGTVQRLGGAIDVDSGAGKGTTFAMYLPVLSETAASRADEPAPSRRGTGRLLVVEDEETVRLATTEMLEALGYQVETAADGEEALRVYRERGGGFDALVLDAILPKMSGKQVFSKVRASNPETRILLVSGYAPEGEIRSLLKHSRVSFLQKPYAASELSEALRALLRG
ncbi:MAG: ATP-binding protein, partial [Myxococcota bacterium]